MVSSRNNGVIHSAQALEEMENPHLMTTPAEETAMISSQDEMVPCCAQCPVHCSKPSTRPISSGLYGQIADLKSQIRQLLKVHALEKDAFTKTMNDLETQHSKTIEKNSNLTSEKRWLESKVKYLSHVVITQGSKSFGHQDKIGSKQLIGNRPDRLSSTMKSLRFTGGQQMYTTEEDNTIGQEKQNCIYAKNAGLSSTSLMNSTIGTNIMTPIQEADEDSYWAAEKEKLLKSNKHLLSQIRKLEEQKIRLNAELHETKEQLELLEFRILELEEGANFKDEKQFQDQCVATDTCTSSPLSYSDSSILEDVLDLPVKSSEIPGNDVNVCKDRLALMQSFALLGLYQKLIRTHSSFTDIKTAPNNIVAVIKSTPEDKLQLLKHSIETNESAGLQSNLNPESRICDNIDHNCGNEKRDEEFWGKESADTRANVDQVLRLNAMSSPLLIGNGECTVLGELDTLEKRAKRFLDSSAQKKPILCHDASTNTDFYSTNSIECTARCNGQAWAEELDQISSNVSTKNSDSIIESNTTIMEELEKVRSLLLQKVQELANKETEYCLRLEAIKCEKEECVHRFECRIETMQERELKLGKECEKILAQKADCDTRLLQQTLAFEAEKDDWLKKLEDSRQLAENLERKCQEMAERDEETFYECEDSIRTMELQEKIEEMKRLDTMQKKKIQYMEKCLSVLKAEVELVATGQERKDPPDILNSVEGDSDDNEVLVKRVKELIEGEAKLQTRIGQLEKKETAYRQTLDEADRIVAEVERNYQERLEEMEQSERQLRNKIKRMEQNERWLNQALKTNSTRQTACGEVKKVGDLLEHLMEAESAEVQLKEKLYECQMREEEIKKRLNESEKARMAAERDVQDHEELIKNVENLKRTEQTLNKRLRELETSEGALRETLQNADAILTAREQSLLETIEKLQAELQSFRKTDEIRASGGKQAKPQLIEKECQVGDLFNSREVEEMTMELQKLNDCEAGLELIKGCLNDISSCVKACPNCHQMCGPAIGQLESQVHQLHEIVFGSCAPPSSLQQNSMGVHRNGNRPRLDLPTSASLSALLNQCNNDSTEQLEETYFEEANHCMLGQIERAAHHSNRQQKEEQNMDQEFLRLRRSMKDLEGECQEKTAEISSLALNIAHLQDENENLKRVLWNTEKCQSAAMDKIARKCDEASILRKRLFDSEAKISLLTKQLRSFEQVQKDKENLQELVMKTKAELKEKAEIEHRLHAENLHLHHKVEALRERVNSLQLLKKDNKALITKQAALEKKLSSVTVSVTPLRQQVAALSGECWQKEQVIDELRKELTHVRENGKSHRTYFRDLRAVKLQSISQSSDDSGITRDHSPTSMTSRESETSDDCILTDLSSFASISEHSPSFSNSQSADEETLSTASSAGRSGESHSSDERKGNSSRIPRYTALNKPNNNGLPNGGTATIMNSNLPLRCQGSKTVDRSTTSSSKAFVIFNKQNLTKLTRRSRCCSTSSSDGSTCSDIPNNLTSDVSSGLQKQRLQKFLPSGRANISIVRCTDAVLQKPERVMTTRVVPSKIPNLPVPTNPDSPNNFHVTRKVGNDGLLVAWEVPVMDASGCSNGSTVSGYQIFVNGALHQNVRSAHRTKALLNNLDFSTDLPMEISIQTLSLTGQESPKVITKYTGDDSLLPLPKKSNAKCAFEQLKLKFNSNFQEKARITEYIVEQAELTKKLNSPAIEGQLVNA